MIFIVKALEELRSMVIAQTFTVWKWFSETWANEDFLSVEFLSIPYHIFKDKSVNSSAGTR